jgi:hypothetical protein
MYEINYSISLCASSTKCINTLITVEFGVVKHILYVLFGHHRGIPLAMQRELHGSDRSQY